MKFITNRAFYLLTFLFFSQICITAQTQRFKAGFNLGLTAAQINGDDSAEFNKLGLSAGVRAYTILTPKSDIIIEILFSQRGSRTKFGNNSNIPSQLIKLNYVEVPIIYHTNDHVGFYARYTRSINLLFKNTDTNPNANSLLSFFLTFGGTYVF